MRLDKSKPYGEVFGMPGIRYSQNRVFFKGNGEPVDQSDPESDQPDPEPKLEDLHHKTLIKMAGNAGGQVTSKAEAIAFLRSLDNGESDVS